MTIGFRLIQHLLNKTSPKENPEKAIALVGPQIRYAAHWSSLLRRYMEALHTDQAENMGRAIRSLVRLPTSDAFHILENFDADVLDEILTLSNDPAQTLKRLRFTEGGDFYAVLGQSERNTADMTSEPTVSVYLDSEDDELVGQFLTAVERLSNLAGLSQKSNETIEYGSIFKKWKAKLSEALSSDELQNRITQIERAFELEHLDIKQADVDLKYSEATSELLRALQDVEAGAVSLRGLLVLKYTNAGGKPVVIVRALSQVEIRTLETYPELLKQPEKLLGQLSDAAALLTQPEVPPPSG